MAGRYGAPSPNSETSYDDGDQNREMPEVGAVMAALNIGTTMTKLPSKGRPEQKTFQLILDEFKISWFRGNTGKEEGSSELWFILLLIKKNYQNFVF